MILYSNKMNTFMLYDGTETLRFKNGELESRVSEKPSTYTLGYVRKVNIISLIKSGKNKIYVGVQNNEEFKEFTTNFSVDYMQIKLCASKKFINFGNIRGNIDGINYRQMIFVYPEEINVYDELAKM